MPSIPRYISGGSSSGSAVAVALGLASFALGTDTAGSGRVPAAFNNLVGYKPTLGSLSMRGVVPACRSLDAMSIFALTAEDAAQRRARRREIRCGRCLVARRRAAGAPRLAGSAHFRFAVPRAAQLEFFGNTAYAGLFGEPSSGCAVWAAKHVEVDIEPLLETARLLYEGPWVAERYLATEVAADHATRCHARSDAADHQGGAQPQGTRRVSRAVPIEGALAPAQPIWEAADVLLLPTAGTHYRIAEEQADPSGSTARSGATPTS